MSQSQLAHRLVGCSGVVLLAAIGFAQDTDDPVRKPALSLTAEQSLQPADKQPTLRTEPQPAPQSNQPAMETVRVSASDDLVRVLTSVVAPESWAPVGGPADVQAVDAWGVLVISQTDAVHREIERLLNVLRQARAAQESDYQQPEHPPSITLESEAQAAIRRKVDAALAIKTQFEYLDQPLSDILQDIGFRHDIPIVIDTRSLEDFGIGTDTPISITLKGVTLRSALHLMLHKLDLTFTVRNEVLEVTTVESVESILDTRIYLVGDLHTETRVEQRTPVAPGGFF